MNPPVFAEEVSCTATSEWGFVLASGSPRRIELLRDLVRKFLVMPVDIDERPFAGEEATSYVLRVSREKALAAYEKSDRALEDDWVLGADTIVVLGRDILGKPADASEARTMLLRLQGRRHEVMTGLCLMNRVAQVCVHDVVRSYVWIRKLDEDEIESYIRTGDPFDKAGSYAVQGLAGGFVARVEGSYTNVVGLPVEYLRGEFRRLGIS